MATAAPSVAPPAMGPRRVCNVCCQAVAAYTCPRCHKAYCSSACYKQHGQQCTEAFYRDQATSQLKATRADPSQQQHMLRILQRMHEQETNAQLDNDAASGSSADSDEEDEAAALVAAGFDAELAGSAEFQQLLQRAAAEGNSFEIDPSQLSPELAARLEALFISGRLSHLVAPWQPWWLSKAAAQVTLGPSGQRVVVELAPSQEPPPPAAAAAAAGGGGGAGRGEARQDVSASLPLPPDQELPSLAKLAGPRFVASPLLPWQLLQLLVAYCAVMRRWNGEPDCRSSSSSSSGEGWEAAEQFLQLAPPLTQLVPGLAAAEASELVHTAARQDRQQEQQQVEPVQVMPDSVRVARMQLAAAATRLDQQQGMPLDAAAAANAGASQLIAGAVPSDVIGLLAVATADALALLRHGRSAVLLALTDSWRLVEQSRQLLKQSQQQAKQSMKKPGSQQQQQPKQNETPHVTAKSSSVPRTSSSSRSRLLQLQQHMKLAARKLHFFMVWCNEQPAAMHAQLAYAVDWELHEEQAMNQPVQTEVTLGVQELHKPPAAATACTAQTPLVHDTSGNKSPVEQLGTAGQEGWCTQELLTAGEQQQQQHEIVGRDMPSHVQQALPQELLLQDQQQQQQQQGTVGQAQTQHADTKQLGSLEDNGLSLLQQHEQLAHAGVRSQLTREAPVHVTGLYDLD